MRAPQKGTTTTTREAPRASKPPRDAVKAAEEHIEEHRAAFEELAKR